jgi:hydrogenase maturation protease
MMAVIGIGSPFGFDRLGWDVVDRLRARALGAPMLWSGVRLEHNERLGAPLLAQMRGARLVVLVDAVQTDAEPGTLTRLELDALQPLRTRASSHEFGIVQTLALGRALGELPPQVVVMGIEAGGQTARVPTRAEVARLGDAVERELAEARPPEDSPAAARRP